MQMHACLIHPSFCMVRNLASCSQGKWQGLDEPCLQQSACTCSMQKDPHEEGKKEGKNQGLIAGIATWTHISGGNAKSRGSQERCEGRRLGVTLLPGHINACSILLLRAPCVALRQHDMIILQASEVPSAQCVIPYSLRSLMDCQKP